MNLKKKSNHTKTMNTKNNQQQTFNSIDQIIQAIKSNPDNDNEQIRFYLSLLELINQDLEKKLYKKALASIQEELDTDYLPLDLIDYFNQALLITKRKMYEDEFDWLEKLDKKELINKTIINFPDNLWYFDYLATKEKNYWNFDDFEFFRHIFITKTYDNSSKLLAAQLLQNIEAFNNIKFNVYNNKLKQTYEVCLTKNDIWAIGTQDYFNEILDKVEDSFYKDPSKEQLASEITNTIMQTYYPSYPDLAKAKELASGIIRYVNNCFENKTPNDKIDSVVYDVILSCINE
ncbi:DUF3196 family protein [Mycoplasma sp. K3]|nr:DUF3196 family protein [Mycoplasma bradburyae]